MTSRAAATRYARALVRRRAEGKRRPAGGPRSRRVRATDRRPRVAAEDSRQSGDSRTEEEGDRRTADRPGRIAVAGRRETSRSCWPIAIDWSCCRRLPPPIRQRLMDHAKVVRAEIVTAVGLPGDRVAALQQGLATRDRTSGSAREPRRSVDHRRRDRAGRQHGLRRQRDAAAGEDERSADGWSTKVTGKRSKAHRQIGRCDGEARARTRSERAQRSEPRERA